MKDSSNTETDVALGTAWLALKSLMGRLALAVVILSVTASAVLSFSGPSSPPQVGSPQVPDAGWQARELGGMQPWWQSGRVAPPPSSSRPWVKPPSMYDTGSQSQSEY